MKKVILFLTAITLISCNKKNENYKPVTENDKLEVSHNLEGKKLMETHCYLCHSPSADENEGRIAPPMVAIKARYIDKEGYNKEEFIAAVKSFVENPTEDKALMYGALKKHGLMPKQVFPDGSIEKIAAFMFDYKIEEPSWFAEHWKSKGNENWSQTYGDSLNNGCQGLLLTSDGNYLSYGETEIYPSSAFNFYLQKIDASGASMWRYTYGGTGADAIFSAKEDVDGGFICTGYSNSYNGFGPLDLVILKFDSLGTFLWKQTYGGAGIDIGYDLIPSVDGNGFIITGKTFSSGTEEYYLLKLNENGLLSGIQEGVQVSGSLQLNPNPAAEKLNVNYALNAGKTNRLVLMDVLGKTIREIELTELSGRFEIDVQDLKVGLYFCALYVDGILLTTQKVVIEH